jgi:ketosteroid isomerase-like protein
VRQSNVEILEEALARFKELGTPDGSLAGPGFVWDMTRFAGWPEQLLYEGREGLLRFISDWTAAWDDWHLETESLHEAAGDKVVAVMRQRGRSKASGLEVEMTFAQVWTFRGGKYLRMEMYSDIEQALAEAGVRR